MLCLLVDHTCPGKKVCRNRTQDDTDKPYFLDLALVQTSRVWPTFAGRQKDDDSHQIIYKSRNKQWAKLVGPFSMLFAVKHGPKQWTCDCHPAFRRKMKRHGTQKSPPYFYFLINHLKQYELLNFWWETHQKLLKYQWIIQMVGPPLGIKTSQ